ncbi:MAG: efflux RND transporter permease subunit [Thermodesulfobacteriota bacterium]|nr:efflux RND transporter permease subunit [Thermodesulfobacteriota bacterium]
MIRKLSVWIIDHRFLVFGVILIVTAFFSWQITRIEVKTEFSDLLPKNHPFIKIHEKYRDQLGDPLKVFLMLQVKEEDIYNRVTLEKVIRITDKLDLIAGVNHNQIYSIASRKLKKVKITEDSIISENLMKEVPSSMEEFRETVRATPGVFGVWVSRDEKSVLFTAGFIEHLINYDLLYKEVQEIIKSESDGNHKIYASGEPVLSGVVCKYQKEVWLIFGATFLTLLIVLSFYFRNLIGVMVAILSSLTGAIWGLGFCSLLGYNLDPLILVIPLLIIARALSHSIQFTGRYFECYQERKNVKDACVIALASMLPPGTLGIATDSAGILLIAVAPIPLMQKLAWICGFWAFIIIFTGIILTPILLSFFPAPKNIPQIVDTEKGYLHLLLKQIAKLGFGRIGIVTFSVMIFLFIFTGWVSTRVHIGDINPGSPILWEDSPYNVAIDKINKNFPGSEELYVIAEGDVPQAVEKPEFLAILDTFQRYMEETPLSPSTFSLADFLPPIQRAIYGLHPKWETMPIERNQISQTVYRLESHSAPGDYDLYFSRDKKAANVIVWYKDHMGDTLREAIADVKNFIQEKKDLLARGKVTFKLASGNIGVLAAINEAVQNSQLLNFILVMSVVFLLCTMVYRSMLAAVILMIPLNLANFMTLTVMHMLGIGLNINTLPIVSVGVGVGIDYGIYLLSRICEEYQLYGESRYSFNIVKKAILTTGKAIFFTAFMMILGVILWYFFSSLRFQAEMGLLLAVIMLVNMLGALLLIPSLIYVFKPKFLGKVRMKAA